jgi:hypothetical protein
VLTDNKAYGYILLKAFISQLSTSQLLNMEKLQKEHKSNILARHGSIITQATIFTVTSAFPREL